MGNHFGNFLRPAGWLHYSVPNKARVRFRGRFFVFIHLKISGSRKLANDNTQSRKFQCKKLDLKQLLG